MNRVPPAVSRCALRRALLSLATILAASPALGQSLFQRGPAQPAAPAAPAPTPPAAPAGPAAPAPAAETAQARAGLTLADTSLYLVSAPKPRTYQKHDKIEVIINETSLQKSEQSLETKKKYDLKAELSQFPSLKRLLEDATIADGISTGPGVGVNSDSNFKGDGTAERKDRFTARISALVIDVKPNGALVLEATETQQFDAETKTLVVSGLCDPKDITKEGTVQSSQLAGLIIKVNHDGALKDSSEKGIITRVFEAIFDF